MSHLQRHFLTVALSLFITNGIWAADSAELGTLLMPVHQAASADPISFSIISESGGMIMPLAYSLTPVSRAPIASTYRPMSSLNSRFGAFSDGASFPSMPIINATAVPETSSVYALVGLAVVGVCARRLRCKQLA